MTFHVGQKVVLIGWGKDASIIEAWRDIGANYPCVGEIYTVRAIKPHDHYSAVLLLEEIDNSHLGFTFEPGIRQEFFRPLTDQKKSVSFTQGAPLDSERFDNRRKVVEPAYVNALINASNAVSDRFDRRAVQIQEASAHD